MQYTPVAMTVQVNLRFRCSVSNCKCSEVVVSAQVIVRGNGTEIYEHTNRCPNCLHLLSRHKPTTHPQSLGEKPASDRPSK